MPWRDRVGRQARVGSELSYSRLLGLEGDLCGIGWCLGRHRRSMALLDRARRVRCGGYLGLVGYLGGLDVGMLSGKSLGDL